MASPGGDLPQRAYLRVLARRGAVGVSVPPDPGWLRAEIEAEVAVLAAKRIVRRAKKIRKAVREIGELAGASPVPQLPVPPAAAAELGFVDLDPAAFAVVLAERLPPETADGHSAGVTVPPGCPGTFFNPEDN